MNYLTYILQAFGFKNADDFLYSTFSVAVNPVFKKLTIWISALGATLIYWVEASTGLDIIVIMAFIVLIAAEFQTGLKVAFKRKGEKFRSRKFGRMCLKIGVYVMIIAILHNLAERFITPVFFGFEISPFLWLYYCFFIMVVFQLLISYLENLSNLGYREMGGIRGFILNKFNKYFEFDGTKDGDNSFK